MQRSCILFELLWNLKWFTEITSLKEAMLELRKSEGQWLPSIIVIVKFQFFLKAIDGENNIFQAKECLVKQTVSTDPFEVTPTN